MLKIELRKPLCDDIEEYCKLNGIEDVGAFVRGIIRDGFNKMKYGNSPFERMQMEKPKKTKPKKEEKKEEVNSKEKEIIDKPKVTKKKITIIKK